MNQIIQPAGWAKPKGYSNGVVAKGRFLAVAGQVGWDEHNHIVSKDFVAQFERALANVLAVVGAAGGKPEHVISLTVYVTDKLRYLGSLAELGLVWRRSMDRHYPAMALVEVAGLVEKDALLEIQALAVLPDEGDHHP